MSRDSTLSRSTALLATALALSSCGASTAPASTLPAASSLAALSDAPLRAAVARLADAWNAGSGARWAQEYWPDGSLVNILGAVFPNAAGVAAVTDKILAGPFKGSTFAADVRRIRFVGTAAAIVDVDVRVTNFRALPPGAVATAPGELLTRFTHVFENRNGVWRIEASHNTCVVPPPAGQP